MHPCKHICFLQDATIWPALTNRARCKMNIQSTSHIYNSSFPVGDLYGHMPHQSSSQQTPGAILPSMDTMFPRPSWTISTTPLLLCCSKAKFNSLSLTVKVVGYGWGPLTCQDHHSPTAILDPCQTLLFPSCCAHSSSPICPVSLHKLTLPHMPHHFFLPALDPWEEELTPAQQRYDQD